MKSPNCMKGVCEKWLAYKVRDNGLRDKAFQDLLFSTKDCIVNCHSQPEKSTIQNHGKFSVAHVDYSTSGSSC